jgi:hypothetical protein
MVQHRRPGVISILAVLNFIGAAFELILLILAIVAPDTLRGLLQGLSPGGSGPAGLLALGRILSLSARLGTACDDSRTGHASSHGYGSAVARWHPLFPPSARRHCCSSSDGGSADWPLRRPHLVSSQAQRASRLQLKEHLLTGCGYTVAWYGAVRAKRRGIPDSKTEHCSFAGAAERAAEADPAVAFFWKQWRHLLLPSPSFPAVGGGAA